MTSALLAQGAQVSWGNDSIDEVTNFDFGETTDQLEVTNHDSPSSTREYIAGLITPAEVTFTVNWVAASHQSIIEQKGQSDSPASLVVTLADGTTFTVDAWVSGYTTHNDATGAVLSADIVFRTTGPVEIAS